MPKNTTIHDLIYGLKHFQCKDCAYGYEKELSYFRAYGKLKADSQFISQIYVVDGKEFVYLKTPSA